MGKNIVICCDGTGNEYGDDNTNVLKLYSILPKDNIGQLATYDPGVGTMSAPQVFTWFAKLVSKVMGLAFGYGITKNIADAYLYLMRTYEPGDKVYIFGFSRGAYTARALAALLHKSGLLAPRDDNLVPYAIKIFKYQKKKWIAEGFKRTFSRECPVHFLGLWDTVKSVGWIYDPINLPYTMNNPSVSVVRHAISIDERRALFRANLWGSGIDGQDILQVWFAGVHSDIGGGYPENESGLAKIAMQWMVEESQKYGLLVDQEKYSEVVPDEIHYDKTDRDLEYHYPPNYKDIMHESLKGKWWLAECLPTYSYDEKLKRKLPGLPPLGRHRKIPDNVLLHESVEERLKDDSLCYKPGNLPENYQIQKTVFFDGDNK